MGDDEIDEILNDIYEEDITAGIRQGPLQDPPDILPVEPEVQTAGFSMKGKSKSTKEAPLFIEDEAGLESLVEEYSPQGSLGFLEKAAKEGSVVKPVSNEVYKAIDGGLDILDSSNSKIFISASASASELYSLPVFVFVNVIIHSGVITAVFLPSIISYLTLASVSLKDIIFDPLVVFLKFVIKTLSF